jgi:hypothetical protein
MLVIRSLYNGWWVLIDFYWIWIAATGNFVAVPNVSTNIRTGAQICTMCHIFLMYKGMLIKMHVYYVFKEECSKL